MSKIAVLSATLNQDQEWLQLLPFGDFKAVDGRPFDTTSGFWHLDDAKAQAFIQNTIQYANGNAILIDCDHQTLTKNQTGAKALATGWISNPAQDIKYIPNQGIFIRPNWTDVTKSEIESKQWGFLSAVFPYDENGTPLYLTMCAVTNDPGLKNIKPIVALSSQLNLPTTKETHSMNELLKQLLIALNVISDDDELTDEQLEQIKTKALENVEALKMAAKAAIEAKNSVAEASTEEEAVDTTLQVLDASTDEIETAEEIINEAALHKINLAVAVPRKTYEKALKKIAVLSAGNANLSVSQILEKGRREGRVIPANEPYLMALGKTQGLAALSQAIHACPPIVSLSKKQTSAFIKPSSKGSVALSAVQKEAARLMGKSEADYLKIMKQGS